MMEKGRIRWMVFCVWLVGNPLGWMGCYQSTDAPDDEDSASGSEGDTETGAETDTRQPADTNTGVDTGTFTSAEPAADTDSDTGIRFWAFEENFDNWDPDDSRFFMWLPLEGSGTYADNGTKVTVDGHDCLCIHELAADNYGYGYAVHFLLNLNQQIDMRFEDFIVSFNIYVPATLTDENKDAKVMFGLYETSGYIPIYSRWWSVKGDQWMTISGRVDTTSGDIDYSGFANDPEEWIFDAIVIAVVLDGPTAAEGDEILFYVDNVIIGN